MSRTEPHFKWRKLAVQASPHVIQHPNKLLVITIGLYVYALWSGPTGGALIWGWLPSYIFVLNRPYCATFMGPDSHLRKKKPTLLELQSPIPTPPTPIPPTPIGPTMPMTPSMSHESTMPIPPTPLPRRRRLRLRRRHEIFLFSPKEFSYFSSKQNSPQKYFFPRISFFPKDFSPTFLI